MSRFLEFTGSGISTQRKKIGSLGMMFAVAAVALPFLEVQQAFAQTTARADPNAVFEEIVVVARRIEESEQSVPLAITALSGDFIESLSITTGTDLSGIAPSLSVQRGGLGAAPGFALRGIKSGVINYFAEAPVNPATVDLHLWDLASVQVIAGPQGTLFGRNSTGGAVLFIPQKPTDEFEGYVKGSVGNYGYTDVEVVVNWPATETLKLRFGAKFGDRDGFVDNVSGPELDDLNREAYRLSAVFSPTSWLTNTTVLNYHDYDEHLVVQINQNGAVANDPTAAAFRVYGDKYLEALDAQDARGQREADLPHPHYGDEQRFFVSNILTAEFESFTAQSITGYTDFDKNTFTSSNSIYIPLVVGSTGPKEEVLTQELQLFGSAFDEFLDYQLGGFYSNRDTPVIPAHFRVFAQPADLVITDPIDPSQAFVSNSKFDDTSMGVYGQVTMYPTPELSLTLGLRYSRDEKDETNTSQSPGGRCSLSDIPSVDLETCTQSLDEDFSDYTYNISVDYTIDEDVLVYAATRRGYNAGGLNFNTVGDVATYDPETLTDYEIGLKGTWSPGGIPIRSNLAVYYSDYEDIQRRVVVPLPFPQEVITNAAAATLYGGQLDITIVPIPELKLNANYGYLHSEYDEFENSLVGNATGNEFAQAPEHTLFLSGAYTVNLPEGAVVASANYQYISSVFSDDNNVDLPEAKVPGYSLVGARLDWQNVLGSSLDLAIFGRNLTDERYPLNTSVATTIGTVTNVYGAPRTYGLDLKYNF